MSEGGPYRDDKNRLEIAVEKLNKTVDSMYEAIRRVENSQVELLEHKRKTWGIVRLFRAITGSLTMVLEEAKRDYSFGANVFVVIHYFILLVLVVGTFGILSRTACAYILVTDPIIDEHREQADRAYCEPVCAAIDATYITRNHSCVHQSGGGCDTALTDACSCSKNGHFFLVNPESGMIRERGPYVSPTTSE